MSQQGGIAVIATPTTVNSNAYARAIHHLRPDARVYSQACPLFVPLVEEGWLDPVTRLTAEEYLKSVLVEDGTPWCWGARTIRCSSLLLQDVTDNRLTIVDSAVTTAEATAMRLAELDLLNRSAACPLSVFCHRYSFALPDHWRAFFSAVRSASWKWSSSAEPTRSISPRSKAQMDDSVLAAMAKWPLMCQRCLAG